MMTTTKKLTMAAIGAIALATASLASGAAEARGGHGGGHGGGFRGGFHGGGAKFHGGRHFGHRWHGHRWHGHRHFYRFGGYGFAYNTCWKYTPYGLVNVCRVLPY